MLRRAQSGYADVVATGLERLAPGRPSVSGPLARNCAVTSMVHFLLEVIETMDTGQFRVNTRGTGNRQYPPSMMLALLVYCYATGRFSSRVIERSSWEDVAVRYLCAGEHPDHDTICKFRRENLKAFERFFVHVLEVATQSGALKKVGTVSVDGTKLKANASKHSAMSHGHAEKVLEQLESEVKELTHRAEEADRQEQSQCETKLPEEIALRQKMKRKLASPRGRERYALRKQTVEPIFGIIKEVMRFPQFLMRGTEKAAGESGVLLLY